MVSLYFHCICCLRDLQQEVIIQGLEERLTVKFPELTYFNVFLSEYFTNKIYFILKFNDFFCVCGYFHFSVQGIKLSKFPHLREQKA